LVAAVLALVRVKPRVLLPGPLAVLAAVALAVRFAVPHLPFNWWFGVSNLPWAGGLFSKDTSYLPLPNRLVAFDFGLGFGGLVALNIALAIVAIVLLWHVTRTSYSQPVANVLASSVALLPMYTRISASDATHFLPFALWCAA